MFKVKSVNCVELIRQRDSCCRAVVVTVLPCLSDAIRSTACIDYFAQPFRVIYNTKRYLLFSLFVTNIDISIYCQDNAKTCSVIRIKTEVEQTEFCLQLTKRDEVDKNNVNNNVGKY